MNPWARFSRTSADGQAAASSYRREAGAPVHRPVEDSTGNHGVIASGLKTHCDISRYHEARSQHSGWQVAIARDGRIIGHAYFADSKYGGPVHALVAAKAFQSVLLR